MQCGIRALVDARGAVMRVLAPASREPQRFAARERKNALRVGRVEVLVKALPDAVLAELHMRVRRDPVPPEAFFAHTSGQPSIAIIGRPECASFNSDGTSPPTPAMHDISASPLRSSRTAT
ncbi:hypothetical protein WS86_06705 [Burkholderia savannae]|nr:hypothetical protein WS86_06705 [Burkholderia savannae]